MEIFGDAQAIRIVNIRKVFKRIRFGGPECATEMSLAIRPFDDFELIYYGHKEVNSYVWSNNWRHYW